MEIKISELPKHLGKEVSIKGWVYRKRESKDIIFIVVRDSSGIVQCVIKDDNPDFEKAKKITIESSLKLSGVVNEDKRAPTGYEIKIKKLEPVHIAETFPITEYQSTELLLNLRHLWIRSLKLNRIFKIRSDVFGLIHEFFRDNGFYEIQAPSIVSSACEGGSTLFKVDYFGKKAYLTQSWQLYAEALIFSLEKIYCIAPSFRAEKSRTRRHLSEYWHAEAEMAWCDHKENMRIQEKLISYLCQNIAKKRPEELKALGRDPNDLLKIKPPFEKITYDEAVKMLQKKGMRIKYGGDLGADEERVLTQDLKKPIFLTSFPYEMKAFYMKRDPNNPKVVLADDLLAPEGYGEIIGGSERETDNKKLVELIKKFGGNPKDYKWYLDLRRYGSVPHSGFGLGIERFIMWICKLDHIRDAIAFPRMMNRVYP